MNSLIPKVFGPSDTTILFFSSLWDSQIRELLGAGSQCQAKNRIEGFLFLA